MSNQPDSGRIFGIPYNFERPSLKRMFGAYWQPGEEMLIEKPFGVGYTLNMANWRSWVVLAVAGLMVFLERRSSSAPMKADDEPIEIIVDDDDD